MGRRGVPAARKKAPHDHDDRRHAPPPPRTPARRGPARRKRARRPRGRAGNVGTAEGRRAGSDQGRELRPSGHRRDRHGGRAHLRQLPALDRGHRRLGRRAEGRRSSCRIPTPTGTPGATRRRTRCPRPTTGSACRASSPTSAATCGSSTRRRRRWPRWSRAARSSCRSTLRPTSVVADDRVRRDRRAAGLVPQRRALLAGRQDGLPHRFGRQAARWSSSTSTTARRAACSTAIRRRSPTRRVTVTLRRQAAAPARRPRRGIRGRRHRAVAPTARRSTGRRSRARRSTACRPRARGRSHRRAGCAGPSSSARTVRPTACSIGRSDGRMYVTSPQDDAVKVRDLSRPAAPRVARRAGPAAALARHVRRRAGRHDLLHHVAHPGFGVLQADGARGAADRAVEHQAGAQPRRRVRRRHRSRAGISSLSRLRGRAGLASAMVGRGERGHQQRAPLSRPASRATLPRREGRGRMVWTQKGPTFRSGLFRSSRCEPQPA